MNKDEMELEKLALELKSLKHPWYLKPSNLISILSLVFAFYQFQLAENKLQIAESKGVKADSLISDNMEKADYLSAIEKNVSDIQKSLIAKKAKTQKAAKVIKNTGRIMDVWAYGVDESLVNTVKERLVADGNEVGFGGLLDYLPSWLARKPTVFYYHKKSNVIARALADDLEKQTGMSFDVSRGAGLGVNKDEKDKTFFIHLVK